jgi:hypothetical protein
VQLAEDAVPEGDVTPAPKEIGARHAAARIFAVETVTPVEDRTAHSVATELDKRVNTNK